MPVVNLTARYVETVKAQGAPLDIRDAKCKGLELRIGTGGGKSWALRYYRLSDGKKRTMRLGSFPTMGLDEAREAAADAKRDVAKGGDPATGKQVAREAPTFRQLAQQWQEDYAEANRSKRVRADDKSVLDRHVLPVIGDMKAHAVARADIGRLLNAAKKAQDGRAGHDTERRLTHRPNKVHEVVRAVYRWAVSEGLVAVDPMQGRKRPIRKEAARERVLTAAEVRTIWTALDRAPAARERGADGRIQPKREGEIPLLKATALAMKLSLVTAQRIGEVSGIPLAELDLNEVAPVWTIAGSRTKNGEAHRVPLSPLAVRLIEEAKALAGESAWLFPAPGGKAPVDPHAATRALVRARPSIGVVDWRIHDLRRTAATMMGEMDVKPHVISYVLNHVSATKGMVTGRHYNQFTYDPEKREALTAWGARLERIISGGAEADNVSSLDQERARRRQAADTT
jgi:integrase